MAAHLYTPGISAAGTGKSDDRIDLYGDEPGGILPGKCDGDVGILYDFRSGGDGRLYTGRLAGCAGGAAFVSESVAAVGRLPDAYSVDRVGLLWDFFEVV